MSKHFYSLDVSKDFFSGFESSALDVSNFLLYGKENEPKSSVELVHGIITSIMSFFFTVNWLQKYKEKMYFWPKSL